MRKFFIFILLIICAFASNTLLAQESSMPICPPNVVGSGARAKGIGDAFIAIADDATAASWNPAGLVQLQKPELSFVLSYDHRSLKAKSGIYQELGGAVESKEKINLTDLNYLSIVYPFSIARRNITFSLNYQRLYDFTRDLKMKVPWGDPNTSMEFFYKGEGSLYSISPAAAIQINPDFYCGITTNIWSDKFTKQSNWENKITYQYFGDSNNTFCGVEKFQDFEAINANLGFFWIPSSYFTIAGVYKTPFQAKVKRKTVMPTGSPEQDIYGDINRIKFPPVYGLGAASRISDSLTLSLDITRTDWDKYEIKNKKGDAFGLFTDASDPNAIIYPTVKPTYSIRFGIEYLKILEKTVIPLRGGFFYDPLPSKNNPQDVYGLTIGTGISVGDFIIDIAYQYHFIDNVPGDEAGLSLENIYVDEWFHQVLLSGIYHF